MRIKAYTPFTTSLIVCASDTCGGGWLFCIRIALLTVYPISLSLSFRVPLPVRCPHSSTTCPPSWRPSTASTFQHDDSRYRLGGGLTILHCKGSETSITTYFFLCFAPLATSVAGIVLSALQSMRITLCRIITLNPTQSFLTSIHPARVQSFLTSIHPAPYTTSAYYSYYYLRVSAAT